MAKETCPLLPRYPSPKDKKAMNCSLIQVVVVFSFLLLASEAFTLKTFPVLAGRKQCLTRRYNFFKGMLERAFENDENLSQADKRTGQLEGPGDEYEESGGRPSSSLTQTQEKWRRMNNEGVMLNSMENQVFEMDFYLSGVPNKDPSNDLYGSRINISSRDRQVGQPVPDKPTVSAIRIQFLPDNKCVVVQSESAFTTPEAEGDWKLSENGKEIRFRIDVTGYTRTVETKGSIQSIFWSDEPDKTIQTSTLYTIPAGWMYGEAELSSNRPGVIQWNNGVLKIEQAAGLMGAGSKMVPCGKFTANLVNDS